MAVQHLCDVCRTPVDDGPTRELVGTSGGDTIEVKVVGSVKNLDPAITTICRGCLIDAVRSLDTRAQEQVHGR